TPVDENGRLWGVVESATEAPVKRHRTAAAAMASKPTTPVFDIKEAAAVDCFIQYVHRDTMWQDHYDKLGSDLGTVDGWSELYAEWERIKTEQKFKVSQIAPPVDKKTKRPILLQLTTAQAAAVN